MRTDSALPPKANTGAEMPWLRRALLALGTAALVSLAACASNQGGGAQGKPLSGYVAMNQVQAAYLGSGP